MGSDTAGCLPYSTVMHPTFKSRPTSRRVWMWQAFNWHLEGEYGFSLGVLSLPAKTRRLIAPYWPLASPHPAYQRYLWMVTLTPTWIPCKGITISRRLQGLCKNGNLQIWVHYHILPRALQILSTVREDLVHVHTGNGGEVLDRLPFWNGSPSITERICP